MQSGVTKLGASEVLTLRKKEGGDGKCFSHSEGRGTKRFRGSINTDARSFNHTGGGHKRFHPLKGVERKRFYPVLRKGGNKFWIQNFFILAGFQRQLATIILHSFKHFGFRDISR